MKDLYKVLHIYEAEFGCEEMPADAEPMVDAELEADDGTRKIIHVKDSTLYQKNINEGDFVSFCGSEIEKSQISG
ncbi:MAG: hypothetical protein Q4F95_04910 [Oscillospiraceae bacterium]|nr:hypothetical protein [Oscillospiraceae bacterium]